MQSSAQQAQPYQPHGYGKKRPAMQPNYHMLTNNAVFPTENSDAVIHNTTKIVRDRNPKLAPTIRPGQGQETAQIYGGEINRPVNDSPTLSPRSSAKRVRSPGQGGQFMSEYQARMLGQDKPDY